MSRSSGSTNGPPVDVGGLAEPLRHHAGWGFATLIVLNVVDLVQTYLQTCGV